MAIIRMAGGQTFDVVETYENLNGLVSSGWTGTAEVTDRSTGVVFSVRIPSVVAVQP